jgi:ATP-dependent Zn protease
MDGVKACSNVVPMATMNRLESINTALWKSGQFNCGVDIGDSDLIVLEYMPPEPQV